MVIVSEDSSTSSRNLSLYINNQFIGTESVQATAYIIIDTSATEDIIGKGNQETDIWIGFIKEVILWNRALDPTQRTDVAENCGSGIKCTTDYIELRSIQDTACTEVCDSNYYYNEETSAWEQ